MPKIGEKRDRDEDLSSSEEEEQELGFQDAYEQDGFVVPDDQVEEEPESPEDSANEEKIKKKPKKVRSRLKKKDNEDIELIESNLGVSSAPIHARTADELEDKLFSKKAFKIEEEVEEEEEEEELSEPYRRQKINEEGSENSESSEESMAQEMEERPRKNYNMDQIHVAANIFGVDPELIPQLSETRSEVFEPAECKERFATKEDEMVRDTDVPERLQYRLARREINDEAELSLEIEWLAQKYLLVKPGVPEDSLRLKISLFINLFRIEKYEVPFIAKYRMHKLHPEIENKNDLWNLYNWDGEWGFIYSNKQHLHEILSESAYNAIKLDEGEEIPKGSKVLYTITKPGEIPEQVKFLLENTSPNNYRIEIEDIKRFINVYVYEYGEIMNKNKQLIMDARKNRLPQFIEKASITPLQLSENLQRKEIIHKSTMIHLTPQDIAFDLLCDTYPEEVKVMEGSSFLLAKEISSLPWVRKAIFEEYMKVTKVITFPTQKGNTVIDIFHQLYHVKHLEKGKGINEISPDLWADIWKAEQAGLIHVQFRQPWKSADTDGIISYASSFYLSEAEENNDTEKQWNDFRMQVLQKAINEIYEGFEKDLRTELTIKSEEYIIKQCQNAYSDIINRGPYKSDDNDRSLPKVFAITTDPNVEMFGQSSLVVLDSNGEVIEAHNFMTLTIRNSPEFDRGRFEEKKSRQFSLSENDKAIYEREKKTIERLLLDHNPHFIIIGANCLHSTKIRKNINAFANHLTRGQYKKNNFDYKIDEKKLLSSPPQIFMSDIAVAKLFASSQRGKRMFPDYDYFIKQAISLGRYFQFPLIETLGLWSDVNEQLTTLLSLHPHQKLIHSKRLEQALEMTATDIAAEYGADLNEMIQHPHLRYPLQFIPGLGPIKAHYLIDNIYKKLHGRLTMRVTLMTKKILSPKVYENCSGFICIPISENETDPLDSTRIHPEFYDLSKKVAESALEVKSEKNDETVIYRIIEKPKLMDDLDLQSYAKEYSERSQGKENIIEVLEFIVAELRNPFKLPHRKFEPPTYEQLMYWCSGETKQTLSEGSIVQVTVMDADENKGLINVKLESGILGIIDRKNIIDNENPNSIDFSQFKRGMNLTACVLKSREKIDMKEMDEIVFKVELSLREGDFQRYREGIKRNLDEAFVIQKEEWNERAELNEDQYRKGQKYVPRVVNHPKFKNIGYKTACEILQHIGDYVFRPSSRGLDHLTCTWKFYDMVFAHLDILEEGKPASNMLGTRFKIGDEVYESLQEIIDRYVVPCDKLTKEAISHNKFRDSLSAGIKFLETQLRNEKRSSPTAIPYCFTISPSYPQFLILIYIPKDKIITEYIKVKPKGLFFHDSYHPSIAFLISWFKRHYQSSNYQSQLKRSKPPEIDTRNHLAVPGKAERPMTPIHRMDNDYMPSTPKRTPEYEKSEWKSQPEIIKDEPDRREKRFDRGRERGGRRGKGERREQRTCHKCGGEGHIARDCPKASGEKCFNCGNEGHFARDCPEQKIKRDEETPGGHPEWEDQWGAEETAMDIEKPKKVQEETDPWG